MRSSPERDLRPYLTPKGHIAVHVEIGPHFLGDGRNRTTGASAAPSTVAQFLRDLAEDVERLVYG